LIGDVLDDTYRVLEHLGTGAMGEVYLVEHVHIGRREAIKVLRPEMAADPRLASRFRREARAINRLRHPNIIGIYDFGQLPDGRLYLTMEYADGRALDQVLQAEGRLDLPRALHVLHQLAGAIDHAHAHGVVHRDLKPNNLILVEERGRTDVLKVLDFGLAKIMDRQGEQLTLHGELFGTPEYMAPERIDGAGDARSDLYAIGCVAYELLTGQPPFTGPRPLVVAAQMQTEPPVPGRAVAGVPGVLDVIVGQLLQKDPAARLASARQLGVALEAVPGFPSRRAFRSGAQRMSAAWATVGAGVEAHDEVTFRDRSRAPRPMAYADTASAATDEVLDEILGALVDLAQATVEQFPGDDELSVALALTHGVRDDRAGILAERTELEDRTQRALQVAREREGSLRFAIAELRFERQRARPTAADALADLDFQIGQLEARVREVTGGLHAELARFDERGIELAAAEADLEGTWLGQHRRLRAALGRRLTELAARAGPIATRFAVVAGALDEMVPAT
jgi:tRNA A-37 threonylcarbamoyl transferase component Bud32